MAPLKAASTITAGWAGLASQPVLGLVARVRSRRGRGFSCSCYTGKIGGPFATVLSHRAGGAGPSLVAAICADCASTAEEATAAGGALARGMWAGG